MAANTASSFEVNPAWYKDAIIYEVHVRAFLDSNADGIGDFRGLTQKLDYLGSLGVTALWLLPFYPSPLKDDGYDIADYYSINPIFGTLEDFKAFVDEAHQRGLRVITELVLNHTSDQHAWFQRSRRAPKGSQWRDFYVWSDTAEKYKDARIIFNDFEPSNWTWDHTAQAYYWHRFYAHQPDLNFENPLVHEEIINVLDFWSDLGVDGFRLDAVAYLYEEEKTSCENLPKTHDFLKKLRKHIDEKYGDRMLLAEANQWPEMAVTFFGERGEECQMVFHFPLMPRLFMAVRMEDRVPIVDILQQTPGIPEGAQWALFLRNHDELTLEMVTDEERDYMYRVYANDQKARINLGIRRRLAPLLGNDRNRIQLLYLLLLSMPGTPVLYYGDEIGMGDNIFLGDRNGVRTPMQWSSDKNAGFSRASPQALYSPIILDPEYHYEAINVENQERNPHSLLWWVRQALTLRKRWPALSRGSLEFLQPENRHILAYVRQFEEERILIVANLSRTTQPVQLDLARFEGCIPVELFGHTEFPAVTEAPYFLTLGPHSACWFSFASAPKASVVAEPPLEILQAGSSWEEIFERRSRERVEALLPKYLKARHWFGGTDREIRSVKLKDYVPVPTETGNAFLTILEVEFFQGEPEVYLLPLGYLNVEPTSAQPPIPANLFLSRIRVSRKGEEGWLVDAAGQGNFRAALLQAIAQNRRFRGRSGEVIATSSSAFHIQASENWRTYTSMVADPDARNTCVAYEKSFILKLFRRLEAGINPELETGWYLLKKNMPHVPPLAGAIEYAPDAQGVFGLGILTVQIPETLLGWDMALEFLSRYFGRLRALPETAVIEANTPRLLLPTSFEPTSTDDSQLLGAYPESARLLGQRTAELHLALSSEQEKPEFVPEPFTPHWQRSLFQSMRNRCVQTMALLRENLPRLPESVRATAQKVIPLEPELLKVMRAIAERPFNCMRIRCHGDLHLGQVLSTGKDFFIIDFEGEPWRSVGVRRLKRSPLYDVARMLRSFHYAVEAAFLRQVETGLLQREDRPRFEAWMQYWYFQVSIAFLKGYLPILDGQGLLPNSREDLLTMLHVFLMDRAISEIGSELRYRPNWVHIPTEGILKILEWAQGR